jgi:hypothetical protein
MFSVKCVEVCTSERLMLLGDRQILVSKEYEWQWWVVLGECLWVRVNDEKEGLAYIALVNKRAFNS